MEPKRVPDAPVPVIFRRGQLGKYLRAVETGLGNAVGPGRNGSGNAFGPGRNGVGNAVGLGRNGSGNAVGPEAALSALPFGATDAFLSA